MAADIFLKISGITGESTDDKHKGEIEILSFSSGVTMPVTPNSTGGSKTRERASLSDLTLTKVVDSASPELFKATCNGQHLDEAILSVNRSDGSGGKVEYLKYTLSHVLLSHYQSSGSEGNGLPIESLSINFAKFKVEYTPTDPTKGTAMGKKLAGWDVMANKPI